MVKPQQIEEKKVENIKEDVFDMEGHSGVKLTRKEIYDEVWSISVAGMSRKYGISYTAMLKLVKSADIPIPPAGYWTKKEFNKELPLIPLSGSPDELIVLSEYNACRDGMLNALTTVSAINEDENAVAIESENQKTLEDETVDTVELNQSEIAMLGEAEILEGWNGQKRNVYRREVLYEEVWQFPVTEVAKKYSVSDVSIHKICKSLDIPTPPKGYWAKKKAGKMVAIPPLPKSDRHNTKIGMRMSRIYTPSIEEQLAHLSSEEQTTVLAVASQMVLVDEHEKMHPIVAACYKKAKTNDVPVAVNSVAKETLPRVFRILDTLIKAIEPLGVKINEKLQFSIDKDSVVVHFTEFTTKIPHEKTKEEKLELLKYEDAKRRGQWARKPQIRQYDSQYNGTLSLSIANKRKFRDSKSGMLEERLGEVLIAIFYCINEERLAREAREEAVRKREEEMRRKEELRERYNKEVADTNALVNMANDYEIARKIRALIESAEVQGVEETWLNWARAKADWFDPTISATDEFFGIRNHGECEERKTLRERWYNW